MPTVATLKSALITIAVLALLNRVSTVKALIAG